MRSEWTDLSGLWDFAFDDENIGVRKSWFKGFSSDIKINVPFAYQTKMSEIGDTSYHPYVWYSRVIEPDWDELRTKRMILIFEGSDFITDVWVNGIHQGTHKGGYARFYFDITESLSREKDNIIVVRAEDKKDPSVPRGKQRWEKDSYGCWYVETTGIWKTVWCEYVPSLYISSLKLTPDLEESELVAEITFGGDVEHGGRIGADVSFGDEKISSIAAEVKGSSLRIVFPMTDYRSYEWGVHTWHPEHPELYDLSFVVQGEDGEYDEVSSYAAMREICIDKGRILLNGETIYQRLILDQGYWPESGLTPPSVDALEEDIDKILQLGYNGLRKHQKIEDERFLYLCDLKGVLVWSEMASAYEFSDNAVNEFTSEWMEIVRQNYSHPCIITWTPFNESWGIKHVLTRKREQAFTEAIYHLTKAFDPMRPVIVNDGWEHTISDIITLHDYEEDGEVFLERYLDYIDEILKGEMEHNCARKAFADGYSYHGQPIIISEFGGIAFSDKGEGWGYGDKVSSEDDFIRRFDSITSAIKELPYAQGYCYTQVTDVEQEINGLMTPERKFKVNPDKIREINKRRGKCIIRERW